MGKRKENLKQELRNAELINRVVKGEREKPTMEDIVGTPKYELGGI